MESEHENGSRQHSKKEVDTALNKDDTHDPLFSLENADNDNESKTDIEMLIDKNTAYSTNRSNSSSSVSSSSSFSLGDCFIIDAQILNKSSPSFASRKSDSDAQTLVIERKHDDVSIKLPSNLEGPGHDSSFAPSALASDITLTHESSLQNMSPVQCPVIQVMERPGNLESDRIPASVFESKPSTPTDWSYTSNESLFSIQIGNHSFSRDHFLMMGGDKIDEMFKSGELKKSAELIRSGLPPLSPVEVKQHNKKKVDLGKESEETGVEDKTLKYSPYKNFDKPKCRVAQQERSRNSFEVRNQSDGSGSSQQPLALPKKKSRWTLFHCSNCSWKFCSCTWSSFWFKWPSWQGCCCTWRSCCCTWQSCCCTCPGCCCAWPSCCCKLPSCRCKRPSCRCKLLSCCCKWPSCHCKLPSCCCKWPTCHCKLPKCCCTWPSCSCTFPSCHGCRWTRSFCKFQCPSVNCPCSSCSLGCCYPWNCRRKRFCSISFPC